MAFRELARLTETWRAVERSAIAKRESIAEHCLAARRKQRSLFISGAWFKLSASLKATAIKRFKWRPNTSLITETGTYLFLTA